MSYLTVVFKDAKPGSKEVSDLLYHPQMAAASWGHSIDDANFWRNKVQQMPSEVPMNTYAKVDDNTIMIDGVKYQKVKQEPKSLYEIIKEWNDDDNQPTCEELADKISVWLNDNRWNSEGEYYSGWNDCLDDLQLKLK